jgi:hypothetical protein
MRGDSLRDFYAKTLALIGLALVGALGALVDYWPASHPLPLVAEALPAPAPAGVAARAEHVRVGAPSLFASGGLLTGRTLAPAARSSRRTPGRRPAAPLVPASFTVSAAADLVPARVVVAFEPPPPPAASIATTPVAAVPVTQVALLAPEPEPLAEAVFTPHGSGGGYGHGDTGFLSDATEAAKKAGTSIMAGTMKTGASIVDGLRTVGGAVRRGLWRFIP